MGCCAAAGRTGAVFAKMRARASHTYDADAAASVVAAIPAFLEEAGHLCAELHRRLA